MEEKDAGKSTRRPLAEILVPACAQPALLAGIWTCTPLNGMLRLGIPSTCSDALGLSIDSYVVVTKDQSGMTKGSFIYLGAAALSGIAGGVRSVRLRGHWSTTGLGHGSLTMDRTEDFMPSIMSSIFVPCPLLIPLIITDGIAPHGQIRRGCP